MATIDYVIVGAEVDEVQRFLKADGTITSVAAPGDTPLNVEFIGALMVKLSRLGKAAVPAADLARFEDQVRNALQVRELAGRGGPQLSDREIQAILDDTTVSIVFETREVAQGETDKNRRILVVPSDRTLDIKEAELRGEADAKGFPPPLAYDLDRTLMLASLAGVIEDIIDDFSNDPQSSPELQAALKAHVKKRIEHHTTFQAGAGGAAETLKNEIMKSPVRAFHRSVGIYATNMCR